MAVYTKLDKENIEEILSNYSIGHLKEFKGIEEGIENTNYFLLVDDKKYILTIYEKRVNPKDLPKGIIHADLFSDNIFFKDNNFSGIIDFYFSCNDFYALEIAICFNALCFDGPKNNLNFNVTKAINFMNGYSQVRKITNDEKKYIKVLSQGSALRFLLTRVFDSLNTVEGAIVKVKDPMEYLVRLEFHKNSKNFEDYFF